MSNKRRNLSEKERTVDDGAFIYAEIEFESEEQARDYQFPIDDAIEVTDDSNYKMKNYWLRTRN